MNPVRVKICGLTRREDVAAAIDAGADALGFVFASSPRQVSAETARELTRGLPPLVQAIGVFRNHSASEVNQIAEATGLHGVQLHGEESPDFMRAVRHPIIKRLAVADPVDRAAIELQIEEFADSAAFLLDPGAGDGKTFRWKDVAGLEAPWVLAGGLTPDNVAEAVREARPFAVDVASGVETAPGIKNSDAVLRFVRAAKEAHVHRNP